MVITDDLDGSAGAQTVAFSLDGVSYEIDLAPPNRARLAGALASFTAAGRRSPAAAAAGPARLAGRGRTAPRCGPGHGRQAWRYRSGAGSAPRS